MNWPTVVVVSLCAGAFVVVLQSIAKHYMPSYFTEKGKNLATKEDIGEITKAIEAVKHENAAKLEEIRTALKLSAEARMFLRQRLETMYTAVDQFHKDFASYLVVFPPLFRQEITYNQALKMQAEGMEGARGKDRTPSIDTAKMLTCIYFPSLVPQLERLLRARDDVNEVLQLHKNRYKQGDTDGSYFLEPFQKTYLRFNDAIEDYTRAIVQAAQGLAKEDRVAHFSWDQISPAQQPLDGVPGTVRE